MIGGLQGNWGLVLLLYAVLAALAIVAHVVWVWRVGRSIWGSGRFLASKLALTALAAATPVVGFYACMMFERLRRPIAGSAKNDKTFVFETFAMAAIGLGAAVASVVHYVFRYTPQDRTLSTALRFLPGFLALYVVMQLILFMAASVFGFSRGRFVSSRTQLVSAALLLAMTVFVR